MHGPRPRPPVAVPLLALAAACGAPPGRSAEPSMFEDFRAQALAVPRCLTSAPPIPASWQQVTAAGGAVRLRLPAGFRRQPAAGDGEPETWIAADSSELVVRVDAEPLGGTASGPGTLLDRIEGGFGSGSDGPTCGMTVGGAPALLFRWVNGNKVDPDSVHGLAGHVLVRPGRVVNVVLLAATRATRDSVMAAMAGIELQPAAR